MKTTKQVRNGAVALLSLLLMATAAWAEPITREQAQKQAEAFMKKQRKAPKLTPVTNVRMLSHARRQAPASATSEYYVFNKGVNEGYVIVSGDDQTEPILGYCDEGDFCYDKMPPALQEMLDDYARQIASLQNETTASKSGPKRDAIPTHAAVAQLMKSKWSQGYPYNLACPQYFTLGRSVTGCVATAMAQLMYYNREKSVSETTADMPAYDTWTEHATYGRLHVEGIPAGSPIDWENMKDEYGTANDKQRTAVANLMHYCGVAAKMDYTNSSSGAQSYDAYEAFKKYFGYGSSVRFVSYADVTSDADWDKIIYNEISNGRPIYISGSNSEAGHAFCCDGYDGNLHYHINWGWGGTSDGYYLLTQLTPGQQGIGGSNDGYNSYRQIIIGLEPENYGEKAMSFTDATVRNICLQNWDANNDGKLTYGEAAEVKDLGNVFKGSAIKNFKELYYFTGLTAIADDAFSDCKSLMTVRLPKLVKHIGQRSFKGCITLSQVVMPDHVTSIGQEAFSGCASLSKLTLPDELSAIEAGCFEGCAFSTVSLPITVTSIGERAFANCAQLQNVEVKTYLPSAIQINAKAFEETRLQAATLHCLQGTKSYFSTADVWKDFGTIAEQRERSEGKFAELVAGKTYYLYNVGTGQYLTKGEAWGTQAIVGETPMRFTVKRSSTMPEGVYYLTSSDTGKDGKILFRTSTDTNVGSGVMAAFVDGSELKTNCYWSIKSAGENMYTIQIPTDGSGYAQGKFWGVDTGHESNAASPTWGVYADVSYDEHPLNCQWRFVLYDEDQALRYDAAMTLSNLISVAEERRQQVDAARAVYNNLESTYAELREAQRALRKQLNLIDFTDDYVRETCISLYDIDSDGELSITEANQVSDLGWTIYMYFDGNTQVTSFDELQYFTNIPCIYGTTFRGCTKLESIVIPKNVSYIYYNAFTNCRKLASINLPEYLTILGDEVFKGCTALRTVTSLNPDPQNIQLGANVFQGVPLKDCTLYVPRGSKELYAAADVWKNFGTILEIRTHEQPKYSTMEPGVWGYLLNLATRKYVTMGEAYGTQSVVAQKGIAYQLKRTNAMPEGTYYLTDQSGNVVFRTSTDTKVGTGVKACFGDGKLGATAYWKLDSVAEHIYTLQVPANQTDYVEGEYLGTDSRHHSNYESPTNGLYWDVQGNGIRWAFVTEEDMEAAKNMDTAADELAEILAKAKDSGIDVKEEQAIYDNFESTCEEIQQAVLAVREKLHYITFEDKKVRSICILNWDANGDDELSREEAAAVTSLGELFNGNTLIKNFNELRYFTSLTELPKNAFRNAISLQSISLPENITAIGDYAFTGCNELKYIVLTSKEHFIPMGIYGVPNKSTLFVPAEQLAAYQSDSAWAAKCRVVEYTGKPVVTAEASRQYGRSVAAYNVLVDGAPVNGVPECVCEAVADRTLPAGTYPITVLPGTITTLGVELKEGVLTILPASLTITAKDCKRMVGQPNPTFEVTYKGFRNGDKESVLTTLPVVTCVADEKSPAGTYEIVVSSAEAQNYVMTYVSGVLTVEDDPAGINEVETDAKDAVIYDLQGRRVMTPKRGLYIQGRQKKMKK